MPDINVTDVPPRILKRLNSEAKKRGVGITTVVSEAVAYTYNLDASVVPVTMFKGGASRSSESRLIVNVPAAVRDRLRQEGPGSGGTIRAVVINALADRYGLKRVPEGRQPRAA